MWRALAIAAVLAGCAQTPDFVAKSDLLRPGVSTKAEAVSLLGPPNSTSAAAGGELLQWIKVNSGLANAAAGHVAILFDRNRVMVRKTHSFSSN